MVDYLKASWTIGGSVNFVEKKLVKFAKTIPKLYLDVKTDQDLSNYSIRAYFKKPNFVYNTDVAILETELIENEKVIFDLEGSKLAEIGTWTIELVLVDNTTENLGATTEISYTVIENVEGSEGEFVVGSDTTNTVGELVLQLETASATANDSAASAETINTNLAATIVQANETNDNITASIETAETAIETIATYSANTILLTEQLMTNLQTDYTTASSNIDTKTTRSIELIETNTNVALEAIDSIPAEVEKITDELDKVDPAVLKLTTELDKVTPAITSLDAKLDEVNPAIVLLDAKIDEVPTEIQAITDEGTAQIALLATANDSYIRDVESDSEEVLSVAEQLMGNLNEDYVSDRDIINAQTVRSIELIKKFTDEAIEVLRKIKEEV